MSSIDTKQKFSAIQYIPRNEIKTKPEWFQGREDAYAEETVAKIVREGFDKSQDPIIVWKNEQGENIVISGHSRFEASGQLLAKGDEDLKTLPVKFFQGTQDEAMDFALLESNRSGTEESLKSDLKAYKRAKEKGYNKAYLTGIFKPLSKLKLLEDISSLNENGDFLQYLGSPSAKSFPYLQRNAQWVGNISQQHPMLTDGHEQEMFHYLYPITDKNSTSKKQRLAISKDKFFNLINKQVSRLDFTIDSSLNLNNAVSASPLTDPIKEEIKTIQKEIEALKIERAKKDETIARAITEGKESYIPKLKKRQEEINQIIALKIVEKEKLEKSIKDVEQTTTLDLFSPLPQKEVVKKKQSVLTLLTKGEYFKANPTKVLGEVYATTDRYNKAVTRVRGNINSVIDGIDVSGINIIQPSTSSLQTIETTPLNSKELTQVQQNNIQKVIEETRQQHTQEAIKEKYNEPFDKPTDELYTVEEIQKIYNSTISEDEYNAWAWYKNNQKRNETTLEVSPHVLQKWLDEGVICYHEGEYLPSILYYAENIAKKKSALLNEKSSLIQLHDEKQYNRQLQGLENIQPPYLTLAALDKSKRLVLTPSSSFVKELKISSIDDGVSFKKYNAREDQYQDEKKELLEVFENWIDSLPKSAFRLSMALYVKKVYIHNGIPYTISNLDERERVIRKAKLEGTRLFAEFLAEGISREDQLQIEQLWNAKYNSYVEINYSKIPIGFSCSKTFKNAPLFIRDVQREGIGFLDVYGSGCIAYDVGLGKTMTAILAMAQAIEKGECKRPLIVVPNQTYANWVNELKGEVKNGEITLTGILPQYQVNELYNLGAKYIEQVKNEAGEIDAVEEKSITVLTYEGFNRLGYNDTTWNKIKSEMYEILNQGQEKDREREKLYEKIEELMGQGLKGGMVEIEALGFDYLILDEAHIAKKSFTQVKGEINEAGSRNKRDYKLTSGTPSMIGLRSFIMSQYILRNNQMRNVVLLTATPFTNSPLEIYSMLALIGYQELEKHGIKNIKDFFDQFIHSRIELVINSKLKPERKEVVVGFNNLIALQQLIFRFINHKTGEEVNIQRPHKIVLPLKNKLKNQQLIPLPQNEQISTSLSMTPLQQEFMSQIEAYVNGEIDLMELCLNPIGFEEGESTGEEVLEKDMSEEELDGIRVLRSLSFASQVTLSPYLYACNSAGEPTAKEFIETSPKLSYTLECIRSVKEDSKKFGVEMPGQIIYSNAGVKYFTLIKEYLIDELGFDKHEIGIIKGGLSATKKNAVKDKFNSGQIKVLIGSSTIKEGMNLQYRATDLYVLWLDWNPTDVQQLAGRIWRQGNRYANVRIIFPLIENSIDIFKFQKLQEKTSRINEIWQRSHGVNTLKLEELNPAELKKALITEPYVLAELSVIEDKETIQDEINSLTYQKEELDKLKKARDTFNKHIEVVKEKVAQYAPSNHQKRSLETLFRLYKQWLRDKDTNTYHNDVQRFDAIRKANKVIKSGMKSILEPRGLGLDFDDEKLHQKLDQEIAYQKELLQSSSSEEAITLLAKKIEKEREKQLVKPTTVTERVKEFASLNQKVITEYVLNDASTKRKNERKKQQVRGEDLDQSEDILAQMAYLEELNKTLNRLVEINDELDEMLKAV